MNVFPMQGNTAIAVPIQINGGVELDMSLYACMGQFSMHIAMNSYSTNPAAYVAAYGMSNTSNQEVGIVPVNKDIDVVGGLRYLKFLFGNGLTPAGSGTGYGASTGWASGSSASGTGVPFGSGSGSGIAPVNYPGSGSGSGSAYSYTGNTPEIGTVWIVFRERYASITNSNSNNYFVG